MLNRQYFGHNLLNLTWSSINEHSLSEQLLEWHGIRTKLELALKLKGLWGPEHDLQSTVGTTVFVV